MDFEIELDGAEEYLLDMMEGIVLDTGVEILTTLTSKPPIGTPIDTGWASSNWLYGSTITHSGPIASKESVALSLNTQYKSLSELLNRTKHDFSNYYIYNNVPYIKKLNAGSSRQQSIPGFIERAIQRATKNVRLNILRQKRILKKNDQG